MSARIFGTFLTWMQEKKDPVFVVATANDISKLPPELLRKGRFDEIFFVDLPTEEERKEIFKIHLTQKQRVAEKFTLGKFAEKTEGYTGAEIEEIIKEALFQSFYEGRDLEDNDVTTAISNVIPLSKTMGENLKTLRHWAKYKAKFASSRNLKMVEAEFGKTLDEKNIPTLKQENSNPFITKEKGKN